jgi:hypothetical protein
VLNSPIVEVAIGLVFVFLILSLVATAINEAIATAVSRRAKFLEKWLQNALDSGQADAFFKRPVIRDLWDGNKKPSYLPSKAFALTFLRMAVDDEGPIDTKAIEDVKSERVKQLLLDLAGGANKKLLEVKADVEQWFDDSMDRVSGWFKRRTHLWLWVIAIGVAIGVNADTMLIARTLWTEPALRKAVAAQADAYAKEHPDQETPAGVAKVKDLTDLQIPIGWAKNKDDCATGKPAKGQTACDPRAWPSSVAGVAVRGLGWLITAAALTLGAPFWFDLLRKVANIRGSGAKPPPVTDG